MAFSLDEKKLIASILGYPRAIVVQGSSVYDASFDSKLNLCSGVCDNEVRETLAAWSNIDSLIALGVTDKNTQIESIVRNPDYLSNLRSQRSSLAKSIGIDVGIYVISANLSSAVRVMQ
jgi:hypothetical protein